jgi:hypothetical protein
MAKDLIRTRHQITKFYQLKSQLQGVALRVQVTMYFLFTISCCYLTLIHQLYTTQICYHIVKIMIIFEASHL